jgi:hypothetical protein
VRTALNAERGMALIRQSLGASGRHEVEGLREETLASNPMPTSCACGRMTRELAVALGFRLVDRPRS